MKLRFIKTGEHSDATTGYKLEFPEGTTVNDFCDAVLARSLQNNERGEIYLSVPGDPWHATISKFQHSIMEFPLDYDTYRDKIVKSARANGGWGAMTYWITV